MIITKLAGFCRGAALGGFDSGREMSHNGTSRYEFVVFLSSFPTKNGGNLRLNKKNNKNRKKFKNVLDGLGAWAYNPNHIKGPAPLTRGQRFFDVSCLA